MLLRLIVTRIEPFGTCGVCYLFESLTFWQATCAEERETVAMDVSSIFSERQTDIFTKVYCFRRASLTHS